MTPEEQKAIIIDNLKFKTVSPPPTGGQTCGIIPSKQQLYSEELDILIEVNYYRSMIKNRELALDIFKEALNKIIK